MIGGVTVKGIRTEQEFMDALRTLRARSGLSYRDIASRMSRVAPRHAMAKSALAALFARDTLPRRPGQLTAIVDVLATELAEPADVATRYLEAWTRLMTARPTWPGVPEGPRPGPEPTQPSAMPAVTAASSPVPPQTPYRPPLYCLPAYREPRVPDATPAPAKSDFEQAGGLLPLLGFGTVLSVITWLPFAGGPVPFWGVWLMWCGPVLLLSPLTLLRRKPRGSIEYEEYLRYGRRDYRPSARPECTIPRVR